MIPFILIGAGAYLLYDSQEPEKMAGGALVGVRKYKTYKSNEWNIELIEQLYKEYYGWDKEDGKTTTGEDLLRLIYHYAETHHQYGVYERAKEMMTENGWTFVSKMAYGGVVTFVKEEDKYKKSWGRKAKHDDMDCVGAFDIKGWKGDYGYLYMLNDFDKKYYSHVPLKANEMLFRYRSDAADIGKYTPVIKINLARGLIYFLEDMYADDDKNLVFEARGVKPLFISVHDKVYKEMTKQPNYKMTEKFEDGGGVSDGEKSGKPYAVELIDTKEILSDEERQIVLDFDKELDKKYLNNIGNGRWLNINVYSEHEHEALQLRMEQGLAKGGEVAIDEKYAKDFDDEDRGWWSDRYKEINGFRPKMSNAELIKWANENFTLKVTKSSDGSKIHKELIYKYADENYSKGGYTKKQLELVKEVEDGKKNRGFYVAYKVKKDSEEQTSLNLSKKSAEAEVVRLKPIVYSVRMGEHKRRFDAKFGKGGIVDTVKKAIADKKAWKTYKRWESINNHSENAVLLAYAVGTKKDQEDTVEILQKHHKSQDGITDDLYQRRNEITRRLYPMFKLWYAKNEEGLKMADGGSVSSKKDPEIAKTILRQLGGSGRLTAMTGAYAFADLGNGLSFRMKNPRANFVKITLNSRDLYNVEVGRIRGATYKVIKEQSDLFFDQMKPFIEQATGLYLSFKDGGLVENPVFTFKTKADYEAAEMRGYIPEYDIVRVVIRLEGSEVDFPVNSEEEYQEVLKTHGKSVVSSYQDKTYYDIQDYAEDEEDFRTDPDEDYKKGGKIKKRVRFVDKVNAIAEKLVGTEVPKRLQYDYGKRYDKKEAEQAGRRIAGSMLKKEKIK